MFRGSILYCLLVIQLTLIRNRLKQREISALKRTIRVTTHSLMFKVEICIIWLLISCLFKNYVISCILRETFAIHTPNDYLQSDINHARIQMGSGQGVGSPWKIAKIFSNTGPDPL